MNGILLDDENDLKIHDGDFDLGETTMQEVGLILETNRGEWKENPLIGANMIQFIRSAGTRPSDVERLVRMQLKLDGKDYEGIKNSIKLTLKT